MKFKGSFVIEYELKVLTGLRIGGSKEEFDIGGTDNPVMKVPVSFPDFYGEGKDLPEGAPYIPGSSLKGKIRSLLEWVYGKVEEMYQKANGNIDEAGKPCSCGECEICIIFGTGNAKRFEELAKEGKQQPGPTRVKFFDAYPTESTLERLTKQLGEGIFTEVKTENQINRITSKANPRKVERVPAGAVFKGRIVFDCYRDGDEKLLKVVVNGFKRLEDNFLGGYGSRGSGRVKFQNIRVEWKPVGFFKGEVKDTPIWEAKDTCELEEKLQEMENAVKS